MKKVMIVLGIILIGLAGCGKSEKESIVGKWQEVDGTQIIEFFKDGTVIVKDKGDPTLTGDYRFLDDNRIRMDLKGLGELFGPIIAEVSRSKSEFTLTAPDGEIEKYRRIKKIAKSCIVGEYILEALKENKSEKRPGVYFFKKDGTITVNYFGKWKVEKNQIEFYEEDKKIDSGWVLSDTIQCSGEMVFTKQKGAKLLKKLKVLVADTSSSFPPEIARVRYADLTMYQMNNKRFYGYKQDYIRGRARMVQAPGHEFPSGITSEPAPSLFSTLSSKKAEKESKPGILWSNYILKDKVGTLEIKRGGTFSISMVAGTWEIENGVVKMIIDEDEQEGKIKSDSIIFEVNDEEMKFVKQN